MPSIAATCLPLVLLLLALAAVAVAQKPSSCTSASVSLASCISYVTGNAAEPSRSCCSGLASVVKTNPVCLCQLLTGSNPVGIPINQTLALAMPKACKVATPPVSQCKGAGVAIPPASPPSTLESRKVPSTDSGGKTNPTTPMVTSNPADVSSAGIFAPTAIGLFFAGLIFSAILFWRPISSRF